MNIFQMGSIMITDSEKNPVTLRALLPGSKTGTLIGKGGQVHKHIQAMFDVKIYFQPGRESPMRLVSAFGHPDNVAKFWREALLRMYASRPFDLNYGCGQKLGIDFLVPKPLATLLLKDEKPGTSQYNQCILAEIHRASHAFILFRHEVLPNSTEQVIAISIRDLEQQSLTAFETGVKMLAQCFQDYPHQALSPYNIYYSTEDSNALIDLPSHQHSESIFSFDFTDTNGNSDEANEKMTNLSLTASHSFTTHDSGTTATDCDIQFGQDYDEAEHQEWNNDFTPPDNVWLGADGPVSTI